MAQIYSNFISGTLSSGISDSDTTVAGSALASMAVVAAPNTMYLVLDPDGSAGAPEIVVVTAHTTSATSATVTRAAQSTTARAHLSGTVFRVAVTKADLDELPFRKLTTTGDMLYASAANTAARLALGTTGLPLVAGATVPGYAKVGTAGIADDAITTALIADDAVTADQIADDAVGTAQIAANAVGSSEIAADAVGSSEIAAGAVGTTEIADDAVTTTKILDANVTYAKQAFTKCRLSKSTTLSTSYADITGWTEDDDDGFYTSGANVTIPADGFYALSIHVDPDDTNAGTVTALPWIDGVSYYVSFVATANPSEVGNISWMRHLTAGQVFKVQAKIGNGADTAKTQLIKFTIIRIA